MTKYYRIKNRVRWKENRGLRTGFGSQREQGEMEKRKED
jgi:hypothetical protein